MRLSAGPAPAGLRADARALSSFPIELHRSDPQGFPCKLSSVTTAAAAALRAPVADPGAVSAYQGYQILRRNGAVVAFEPNKIAVALMKAFLAVHGTQGAASASVRETVDG